MRKKDIRKMLLLPVPHPRTRYYLQSQHSSYSHSKKTSNKNKIYGSHQLPSDHFASFHSNQRRRKGGLRCGILVFNPTMDKLLLISNNYTLRRGLIKWGAPKGHINPGESFPNCAMREGKEETGLNTIIYPDSPKIFIKNTWYFPMVAKYEIVAKPEDTKEIAEAGWIPIDKLDIHYNINRELRHILTKITRIKVMASSSNAIIYDMHKLSPRKVYKHPHSAEHITKKSTEEIELSL